MQIIYLSTIILSILGLLIGIFLGIFSNIFKVDINEKTVKIRNCLPGNNCGGCGYAGCDALAEAISTGIAKPTACPVCGHDHIIEISNIVGVKAESVEKKVAFVHCNGTCENTDMVYNYEGPKSCRLVYNMPNHGEKKCEFACIGFGDCVNSCQFNAIYINNSVAIVDKEKCKSCGECIKACPMNIIDFVPYEHNTFVKCNNKNIGKVANESCKVSCIACKICEKNCPKEAITVINNLATIDYTKCNNCNICKEKCPRKCII